MGDMSPRFSSRIDQKTKIAMRMIEVTRRAGTSTHQLTGMRGKIGLTRSSPAVRSLARRCNAESEEGDGSGHQEASKPVDPCVRIDEPFRVFGYNEERQCRKQTGESHEKEELIRPAISAQISLTALSGQYHDSPSASRYTASYKGSHCTANRVTHAKGRKSDGPRRLVGDIGADDTVPSRAGYSQTQTGGRSEYAHGDKISYECYWYTGCGGYQQTGKVQGAATEDVGYASGEEETTGLLS